MSLLVFFGTFDTMPVADMRPEVKVLMTAGRNIVIVNGVAALLALTPAWVPPRAETANCFPFGEGAVSAVSVKVGEVKPVCAAPVSGLVKFIAYYLWKLAEVPIEKASNKEEMLRNCFMDGQ